MPVTAEMDTLPVPRVEQFKGCILGCALGDVIGAWAERRPAAEARDYATYFIRLVDFAAERNHHGALFGQYTDDTQLTRELALSIVGERSFVAEDFAARIAKAFAQDLVVGYGRSTKIAATRLQRGVPWSESGLPAPAAGNGAAMRAAPIGLLRWNDVDQLIVDAVDQAVITHKAEMSVAGAVTIAVATAMCLNASRSTSGPHEPGWWSWLARFVARSSKDFSIDVEDLSRRVFGGRRNLGRRPGSPDERDDVFAWIKESDDKSWDGISPWARSSVLWSLYCVMAHPTDVWKAIEMAIIVGGDTDTTAAMAGAIVGAHVGLDRFPAAVVEQIAPRIHDARAPLWGWEALETLAARLHEVATRPPVPGT
jgi:ADP-ribosylglycohydrolase